MMVDEFIATKVEPLVTSHPVIKANPYTNWFAQGKITRSQMADFYTQYAVISSKFVPIQALRVAHADTPESERMARWILVTELGVRMDKATGSPEGKAFSSEDAHVNWIRKAGPALGLDPLRLGRWHTAADCTKLLLENLQGSYSSPDSYGAGASFGLEVWAGFGIGTELDSNNFWTQIVGGIQKFNAQQEQRGYLPVDATFFKFHHDIEIGHTQNVYSELRQIFPLPGFNSDRWYAGVRFSLDTLNDFWRFMNQRRKDLE